MNSIYGIFFDKFFQKMDTNQELDDLSRVQLYAVIKQLKGEINCLKTELTKHKLLTKDYQKFIAEINETIASNNEIIRKDMKLFSKRRPKGIKVEVTAEEGNREMNSNKVEKNRIATKRESIDVKEDMDSDIVIDSELNKNNDSSDVTQIQMIAKNWVQNWVQII